MNAVMTEPHDSDNCYRLSAVMSKLDARRNAELRLLTCEGWIVVGHVAIPPDHPVPPVGAVLEVRYGHDSRQRKALYQPSYLGHRTDIEPHECISAQLKFKPAGMRRTEPSQSVA